MTRDKASLNVVVIVTFYSGEKIIFFASAGIRYYDCDNISCLTIEKSYILKSRSTLICWYVKPMFNKCV